MRTNHVIGFDSGGLSSLVIGTEVPIRETVERFRAMQTSGQLPKGVVRAQLYDSEDGLIGLAIAHDLVAKHKAELAKREAEQFKKTAAESKTPSTTTGKRT